MSRAKIDRRLDLRGKVCPYPTFETAMVLNSMEVGEVLEIVSDYYPAKQTIPDLLESRGFAFELIEEDNVVFRVLAFKA